jgi:PAS domain S-box-containing protein
MSKGDGVRSARIATVHREVNQALVRAQDRADVEETVCDVLTDSQPYVFAWVGEHDPTTDRVVPRASGGSAGSYLEGLEIRVEDPVAEPGPTARALTTGEVQVCEDVLSDPAYEQWRDRAREHGFASSAAVPITHDDAQYGVLNVYAPDVDAFDETERELLAELGATIANAVVGIEARAALATQSRRYERLTDRIEEGFYEVDSDWTVTHWNDTMAERTDVPAEDIVGETLWEAIPALEGMWFAEEYRTAMQTGEPRSFETYVDPPYDYWVEVDVHPDEEGLSVFSRDVTERKRRERQLEALVENTTSAIYIKDHDGVYQLVNEAAAELFDLEPEAVVGRTDEELFDPDSAAAVRDVDREVLESGRPDTRETVRYIDGEKHVFLDNKFPYRDESGDAIGVMGVSHEITERKAQELELAETNEILQAIITASPDAVVMVDADHRVTMWNPAAEELFGWDREAVLGERTPFVPEEKQAEFERLVEQLDDDEPARGFETVRLTSEGELVDVSISSARVDVDGELVGYMATMEDISDRKAHQRRLEEQNDKLEVLLRLVRHDIGNDVQAIQGYAGVLADRVEDETARDAAEVVLTSADHAVELTRTVRDLVETVIDGGDGTEPVELSSVLDRELDDVQTGNRSVLVERASTIPRITVEADGMLGSVFRNVLRNAVDHAVEEPVRITVDVVEREDWVTVHVADDGPGIPDDRKDAVLGKGEQGVDSTGTGIGLYLVEVLVDGYGGEVWIEDNEPRGTVVCIELPKAD